jgi:GxxExxY protein
MMKSRLKNIVYPELSYKLNGIFFSVHNKIGYYGKEIQYSDAIEILLRENDITYEREYFLVNDSNLIRNNSNKVDFLIERKIIIEVKAKRFVGREEYNQMQRYLQVSNKKLGVIVNFHQRYLVPKRIINSKFKN